MIDPGLLSLLTMLVASPAAASVTVDLTVAQVGSPGMRGTPPPPAPPVGPGMRGTPPPPPPVERVEPRRGFVWVEGNYEWRDGRYVWGGGHWEPERPGRRWHGGRWDWRDDRYVWVRGEWIAGPAYAPPRTLVVETPPPAPPPPPQVIGPQPPPRPGFVWIAGANEWRDGRYLWVDGHWERERRGHRWQSGHWDRDGDRHAWHPGEWHRDDAHEYAGDGRAIGPISIAGRVVGPNGAPVPGIPIVLAGTSEARAVTDGGGNYVFSGLGYGSYAVRPTVPGCSFAPDVVNLNNLSGATVQNFSTSCGRR